MIQAAVANVVEGPEPRNTTRRFYRPELDALRFFAFSCVFLCHGPALDLTQDAAKSHSPITHFLAVLLHSGAFGLPIFFLLSAYLITELLIRERSRTGEIHLRDFYVRRILRIWPLYYLGVSLGIAAGIFFPRLYRLDTVHLLSLLFFFGWLLAGTLHSPVALLWTISVEELFYLIWPSVAKFGGFRLITFVSLSIIPVALATTFLPVDSWSNPVVQFQFFALGALLAIGLKGRSLSFPLPLRIGFLVAALPPWFIASSYTGGFRGRMSGPETFVSFVLIAAGSVLIFLSIFGLPARYLPKPILYLGKISYGLYVFHLGFLALAGHFARFLPFHSLALKTLATSVIALTSTIVTAAVSYRFFETPFLRLKDRFTFVLSRPA